MADPTLDLSQDILPDDLEVDRDDHDSTMGDDHYTITTSLASNARAYAHHNGRRYHAFSHDAYFMPNDELEASRLDLQHYIWKITLDGALGRVPITPRIRTVLDVGTGTGIWAMELADSHPDLRVIGTDLSPIQPDVVPPNCQFLVDNAEEPFAFDTQFDYIHARMLVFGMHDWERFFRQCYDALTPGGWLESSETCFPGYAIEGSGHEGPFITWGRTVAAAARQGGIDTSAAEKFAAMLGRIGFVNVERADAQWPLTPWAKRRKNKLLGRLLWENAQQGVPSAGNFLFSRYLGWSKEDIDRSSEEALKDVERGHYYYKMILHKAQKPELSNGSTTTAAS